MGQLRFRALLARSSLGSDAVRRVRANTPTAVADAIVDQVSATERTVRPIGDDSTAQPEPQGAESVSRPNDRHVVPNSDGGWDVKAANARRASSHHHTQADAERRAKEIVGNLGGGEVRIHGRDGRIRDSDTVAPGRDPFPPRDRRH